MKIYMFVHNGERFNEEIKLIYEDKGNIVCDTVGNVYNVIDYINNNIDGSAKVKFVNFTDNKLNLIVSAVTRYRSITSVNECYSFIIGNKKRIRGR